MKKTKEIIQAQLPEGEFKEWESKYADRGQLILNVVSIVIFFFFFFFFFSQIMHQTEHYQTLSNNFKLLFFRDSAEAIIVQVQYQPRQRKDRVETQQQDQPMKKKYKCRIQGCDYQPFQMKHSLVTHLLVFHEQKGSMCQICGKMMSKYHLSGHMDKHSTKKCLNAMKKSQKILNVKRPTHKNLPL